MNLKPIVNQIFNKWRDISSYLRIRYVRSFAISLFLFYLTTYGDSIAFQLGGSYWVNPVYYVIKLIILLIFISMSQLIPHLYYQVRGGNKAARQFVTYFLIYAGIMCIIWLLVYPGSKHDVDEAYVLLGARTLDVTLSWHHSLTVVWYAIALGIFPSLATITLVEFLLISAVVAYIMLEFHRLIGSRRAQVLFYVFLLPSVLGFNLTPLRLSVYAFLEALLFFIIMKTYLSRQVFSSKLLMILGAVTGVIASVRSESIVFIALLPIVLAIICIRTKRISWRNLAIFTAVAVFSVSSVNFLQNLNTKEKTMYQVTGLMEPLSFILRGGDYRHDDKAYVKKTVDKAIDYDRLIAGENANEVYWSRLDRTLSESDMASLRSLFVRLILENPDRFVKGSVKNFLKSNFLWPDLSKNGIPPYIDYRFTENLIAYRPISEEVRDATLAMLRSVAYDHSHYSAMTRIVYNVGIVMVVLVAMAVYMIWRRDVLVILLLPLVAKNLVIAMTAPFPSFYYYYPLQLTGLVLAITYFVFIRSDAGKGYTKQLRKR